MPEQKTPSKKTYKLEEIRSHSTPSSLWIVIHNHVYDVTKFLDEHPGGEEVLIEVGGGNGSEAFEDVGHSTDARELMKDYHIGEVSEEDKFAEQSKTSAHGNAAESSGGFFLNWVLPAAVGIGVAVVYRVFFSGSS